MNKEILLSNIDKVHTTEMGIDRIKKNLRLDTRVVLSYTHLRAHETDSYLVCRLLLEKKK